MISQLVLALTLVASLLSCAAATTIVKRDVLTDAEDAVGGFVDKFKEGSDNVRDQIENAGEQIDRFCLKDTDCFLPIQHCDNSSYKVAGRCEFVVWFWILIAAAVSLLFCSCITSVLCCCCSSLCRKAT